MGPTAITEPFLRVQVTFSLKSFHDEQTAIFRRYSSRWLAAGSGMIDHQLPNSSEGLSTPHEALPGEE